MLDYRNWAKGVYYVGAELLGWTLLLAGVAMMILPGPGILGLVAGIVVLSTRYEWARRLKHKSKDKVEESMRVSVETRTRVGISLATSGLLIAWGVVMAMDPLVPKALYFSLWKLDVGPRIPGAGLASGLVMVASALVALALVSYSAYRYRIKHPEMTNAGSQ